MSHSFVVSPAKSKEISARHEQMMAAFERDIEDRRRAVCRACRRTFLAWLSAAAEDRSVARGDDDAATTTLRLTERQQPIPLIDYGREHVVRTLAVRLPLQGWGVRGGKVPDRDALLLRFSPLTALSTCLPLVEPTDATENNGAATRALSMLCRLAVRESSRASNAVLVFCGTRDDMVATCFQPVHDFGFDVLCEDGDDAADSVLRPASNATRAPVAVSLTAARDAGDVTIDEVAGLWGATLAVSVRDAKWLGDVVEHCMTLWNATTLSIAISNTLNADECCTWVNAAVRSLDAAASEAACSLRVMHTTYVSAPPAAPNLSAATSSAVGEAVAAVPPAPTRCYVVNGAFAGLGMSVRFFVGQSRLAATVANVTKRHSGTLV